MGIIIPVADAPVLMFPVAYEFVHEFLAAGDEYQLIDIFPGYVEDIGYFIFTYSHKEHFPDRISHFCTSVKILKLKIRTFFD